MRWGRPLGILLACLPAWHATIAAPIDAAPGTGLTPESVASLLASLHPDYTRYIGAVRFGTSRFRPATLYAGLVRRGGLDPRDPSDGPNAGPGAINDLIIYTDTFEPWRTQAWRRAIADHEYFHARHLAGGFSLPVVSFGDGGANRAYYEALAWNYVIERSHDGIYGAFSSRERAEMRARYLEHHRRFRRFVARRQPSAWAHYGRFLPDPATPVRSVASAPREAPGPGAGVEPR